MSIKHKEGECPECNNGKEVPLIAGRCSYHYWLNRKRINDNAHKKKPPKPKKTKAINYYSDKRKKVERVYSEMRKVYLEHHPDCEAKLHCCTGQATEIHHKQGRGIYLLNTTTWLAVCRSCHRYIEDNPKFAKEKGLSENRL